MDLDQAVCLGHWVMGEAVQVLALVIRAVIRIAVVAADEEASVVTCASDAVVE